MDFAVRDIQGNFANVHGNAGNADINVYVYICVSCIYMHIGKVSLDVPDRKIHEFPGKYYGRKTFATVVSQIWI